MQSKHMQRIGTFGLCGVGAVALAIGCQQMKDGVATISTQLEKTGMSITGDAKKDAALRSGFAAGEALMLDESDENGFGQSVALKVSSSPGYVSNDALNAYVQKVGLVVAAASDSDIVFTFGVLDDERPNALSAPRGYVFVTRGLLKQIKDESELAGVLAHEIAHVNQRHGLEAVRMGKLTKAGTDYGVAAVSAKNNLPGMAELGKGVNDIVAGVYNPAQETDADKLAVQYLKAANYDPNGFVRVLERLSIAGNTDTAKRAFPTHPPVANRIAAVKQAIGTGATGETLAARFAANVKF